MNKNLMTIAEDALALEQLILENGGELTPELEAWLDEVDRRLSTKADSYSFAIDRFESTAEVLRKRAESYVAAARTLDNTVARLKDRIKTAIMMMEKREVRGKEIVFKLQNSAAKLVLKDIELPKAYMIAETFYRPDRERILAELKDGAIIPGAVLLPNYALRTYVNKERTDV